MAAARGDHYWLIVGEKLNFCGQKGTSTAWGVTDIPHPHVKISKSNLFAKQCFTFLNMY